MILDYNSSSWYSKLIFGHSWRVQISLRPTQTPLIIPSDDFLFRVQLLGLAMYNGINLDIRFPMAVYKKLLSPAIVPYNNPHQPVGIAKFGMTDFIDVFPVSISCQSKVPNKQGGVVSGGRKLFKS